MAEKHSKTLEAAIIASLTTAPKHQAVERLRQFSARDWQRLGPWLHASGLALYFLDSMQRRGLTMLLPRGVLQSLAQNREDNHERVNSLVREFVQINTAFQNQGVRYLNIKGFSLGPEYCPEFALRSQFDLDLLVSDDQVSQCKALMQQLGYEVVAVSRATIEFRAGERGYPKLRDFYKPRTQRVVELHVCPREDFDGLPTANGLIEQFVFPTLSREQMFIRQALHLTKHLRSEWTRASWMLELANAIEDAAGDAAFWQRVAREVRSSEVAVGIGIAVLATSTVFQIAVPGELSRWSIEKLPEGVRRWVAEFALQVVTARFPGSKLYLLLDRELLADGQSYRSQRRSVLWPARVPGFIATPVGAKARLRNLLSDAKYVALRTAFHVREGARFLREERAWKKRDRDSAVRAVVQGSTAA
jgi:Uncharacterised nucleotidyltransferase